MLVRDGPAPVADCTRLAGSSSSAVVVVVVLWGLQGLWKLWQLRTWVAARGPVSTGTSVVCCCMGGTGALVRANDTADVGVVKMDPLLASLELLQLLLLLRAKVICCDPLMLDSTDETGDWKKASSAALGGALASWGCRQCFCVSGRFTWYNQCGVHVVFVMAAGRGTGRLQGPG